MFKKVAVLGVAAGLAFAGATAANATDRIATYEGDCTGFTISAVHDIDVLYVEHVDALTGTETAFPGVKLEAGETRFFQAPETAGQYNWWYTDMRDGGVGLVVNDYPVECPPPVVDEPEEPVVDEPEEPGQTVPDVPTVDVPEELASDVQVAPVAPVAVETAVAGDLNG